MLYFYDILDIFTTFTDFDDISTIFNVRGLGDRAKVEIWKFFVCFQNTHGVCLEKTQVSCVVRGLVLCVEKTKEGFWGKTPPKPHQNTSKTRPIPAPIF